MLGRIIKRDRLIVMRSTFADVSRLHQRSAHKTMPDHKRACRPLLLSECEEPHSKVEHSVAELLQVLIRQIGQDAEVYSVLTESGLVLLKAKAPQPTTKVHDGALTPPGA